MDGVSIVKPGADLVQALFPGYVENVQKKASISTFNMIQKIPN
jgi:hypothetical protein